MSVRFPATGVGFERKRALVVHEDPTAGCRVADRLAINGYEAILARYLDDVQAHAAHIRPNVIVVDLQCSGTPNALSRLQSICPLVPIIAMVQPYGQAVEHISRRLREADSGTGVFVCRPSDYESPQVVRVG
jgi:DNA-binding response OmpR family regulator